jgi:uncharacterized membrane protein YvbJ
MKYCSHCGAPVADEAVICVNCGCAVTPSARTPVPTEPDVPSTGLNVLAFFIPIVGLILYLVEKDTTPLKAKQIGKWALIGFITGIVFSILFYVVFFAAMMTSYAAFLDF